MIDVHELGAVRRDASPRPARRVLVADDQAALRLLCRVNLELDGMVVIEAVDGHAALRAARSESPDVILLDIMMPGLDGWAVAQALRDDPETRGVPIIFLSAQAELASQARGLEIGGVDYITKPFDPVGLGERIELLLARINRGATEEIRKEGLLRVRLARQLD